MPNDEEGADDEPAGASTTPDRLADEPQCGSVPRVQDPAVAEEWRVAHPEEPGHSVETPPDRSSADPGAEDVVFVEHPDETARFEWDLDEVRTLAVQLVSFAPDSSLLDACFGVVAPDGRRWTPSTPGRDVLWMPVAGDWMHYVLLVIPTPEDGTWSVEVSGLAAGEAVAAVGHLSTPYELVVESGLARVGEPHAIEVSIRGETPLDLASIAGHVRDPASGREWPLEFRDDGEGHDATAGDDVHTAVHRFEESGSYELTIHAVAPEVTRHQSRGMAVVDADWEL